MKLDLDHTFPLIMNGARLIIYVFIASFIVGLTISFIASEIIFQLGLIAFSEVVVYC